MGSIAEHVTACLQGFNGLCSSPSICVDVSDANTPHSSNDISLLKLQNELSRFKVWSGNIGAHRKGRSSLDHRLRDASNIRDQLVELLQDLKESLQDGETTPWEKELSPDLMSDDDSDGGFSFQMDSPTPSELSQIFTAIVEDINCLLRLSVSIHNPSPHDRFKKAALTDTSNYEHFDVEHVRNKLTKASKPIAERLGKAISRRRQYFKYWELHHEKLASGLEEDDKYQIQSTVASSLPKKLNLDEPISLEVEEDDASDAGRSQTSWATSAVNTERRKLPALPPEARNGPFECPFCFMMISISSRHLWKKHVFSDLFPYICVELGCPAPDQDFQRRHQWADHVNKHLWKTWNCSLGCNKAFDSYEEMKRHLKQKHSTVAESTHLDSLIAMCEKPKPNSDAAECPLCKEKQSSFKRINDMSAAIKKTWLSLRCHNCRGEGQEGLEDTRSFVSRLSFITRLSEELKDKTKAARGRRNSDTYSPGTWSIASSGLESLPEYLLGRTQPRREAPVKTSEEGAQESVERMKDEPKPSSENENSNKNTKSVDEASDEAELRSNHSRPGSISSMEIGLERLSNDMPQAISKSPPTNAESDLRADDSIPERSGPLDDVIYLTHDGASYAAAFPRNSIEDSKLLVSQVRERAAQIFKVPADLRDDIWLFYGGNELEFDGMPIQNYGVERGTKVMVRSLRVGRHRQTRDLTTENLSKISAISENEQYSFQRGPPAEYGSSASDTDGNSFRIKVSGSAVVRVPGAEIECGDGGELTRFPRTGGSRIDGNRASSSGQLEDVRGRAEQKTPPSRPSRPQSSMYGSYGQTKMGHGDQVNRRYIELSDTHDVEMVSAVDQNSTYLEETSGSNADGERADSKPD
ncbi:Zinc finger transcription factor ace1 [Fusarium austroafricanum]|uniref:Zinc finger transcription factor ace1 n=1 Tax=Fusarium austroafricanum TaxID=2364996 RepID=A0A8H4NZ38_9HYPO|nr:Zinc finger transcription factor ace1 [Fusarium austroafricanum]